MLIFSIYNMHISITYDVSIVFKKRNCFSGIQNLQEDYQVPLSKLTLTVTQQGLIQDRHIYS